VIRWRDGVVTAVGRRWPGAVELDVTISGGEACRALAYPALTGLPSPGDRVLLNTTALAMGLGTGGYAFVVAMPDRLPPDGPPPAGHVVKARYTPLQVTVPGADEQDSPHHEVLRDADELGGMPVVIADLHSALPAVLAGARAPAPSSSAGRDSPRTPPPAVTLSPTVTPTPIDTPPRCVYVMQDGGALPLWFSRTCAGLREAGWLAGTITVGQAFGGDLDAVTLHTGLLAARHVLGADLAVVTQGPGNLGTGTRWGFSGVACGEAVNAAAVLTGRPVASLRLSEADPRERHRGVSHHSLTAYGRVALARADVVVPDLPGEFGARVSEQAAALGARHRLVRVPVDGLREALAACPVPLSTMGRGLDEDLAYFLAAAAAGRHALSLLA
jgi:hypothetical protein